MSSVCSRSHIEVQRVTPLQEETEDEQVDDGHQPLFDMMETVYQAVSGMCLLALSFTTTL